MSLTHESLLTPGLAADGSPCIDGLVGEVHAHDYTWELIALDRLALALLDLNDFLNRNLDLEDGPPMSSDLLRLSMFRLYLVFVTGVR